MLVKLLLQDPKWNSENSLFYSDMIKENFDIKPMHVIAQMPKKKKKACENRNTTKQRHGKKNYREGKGKEVGNILLTIYSFSRTTPQGQRSGSWKTFMCFSISPR